jgi:hypothetical protein
MSRRWFTVSALALALIIGFVYYPSLWIGFFAQDYDFINPVASLDLAPYLRYILDPRVQVLWYRPLQGIQFLLEFWSFGSNPVPYHIVNIAFHIITVVIFFALVWRVTQKWRIGFLAALLYAIFPVYALAVNWINITDPLMSIFYLSGIWFWLNYLEKNSRRDYIIVHVLFACALLNKQMAITLPAILFLLDRLLIAKPITWVDFIRRYMGLGIIVVIFMAVQYTTQSTHTFAEVFGYSLGVQILHILTQYLLLLVFPWGYYPPTDTQITEGFPFAGTFNFVWLAIAVVIFIYALWRWRSRALLILGISLFVTLIPVLPFPFIELRYLYLPSMITGILLALWIDRALNVFKNVTWARVVAASLLGLLVIGGSYSVANANAGIAEIARQRRVPFRDIARQHPSFPQGTLLYFIDPITPLPELTGMFLMQYGRGVSVGGNLSVPSIRLRDYPSASVYYFDSTGKPIEVSADLGKSLQPSSTFPVVFQSSIVLDNVEIVRPSVKRGDVLIVLSSWHASGEIDKDYTVFVHLVDKAGNLIAGYDSQPRKETAPTSQWRKYVPLVDPILLSIPEDAPLGNDDRLEIGLYDASTMQRLSIADAGDAFVIQPLSVVQ